MKVADVTGFFVNPALSIGLRAGVAAAGILSLAAVVGFVYYVVVAGPAHDRLEAAKGRASAVVSAGDAKAAQDATAVVAAQATAEAAEDDQTRKNQDAITKAPGAAAAVDPSVDLAGRLSICRRKAYRDSPRCVALLKAHP